MRVADMAETEILGIAEELMTGGSSVEVVRVTDV